MNKASVVIVEDEAIIAMDIENILSNLGYNVVDILTSGRELITKVKKLKPDILLVDIVLAGGMNGIDAVKQVKQKIDIPVIYLTAHNDDTTFKRALETEPYGYVLKPAGKNDLYFAIESALQKHELVTNLRVNEEKLRILSDYVYDWEYWIDPKNKFVYISPSCEKITGYSVDEFLKDQGLINTIIHPEDQIRIVKHHNKSGSNRKKCSLEYRIITKNGDVRWISHTCQSIHDQDGIYIGQRGRNRDITDCKRYEEIFGLKEYAIESCVTPIAIADKNAHLIYVNPSFLSYWGYGNDKEVLGRSALEFWDDKDEVEKIVNIIQEKGNWSGKLKAVKKNKTAFNVQVSASMVYDKGDNPIGMMSSFIDITQLIHTEEALNNTEIKFLRLIEAADDPIIILDANFNHIYENTAYYKSLGYARGDVIKGIDNVHPDDLAMVKRKTAELYETGKATCEYRIKHKDGHWLLRYVKSVLLYDENHKPETILVIIHDITQLKKIEEQLEYSLIEKETLLKEVHHRVKNNFQIIISLLNLQGNKIRNKRLHDLFLDSQNRIRAMALIHERLYKSDDLTQIDFSEYINIVARELYQIYGCDSGRIKLKIDAERVRLNINYAIPCGLIINEIISNSIKYAFPAHFKGNSIIKIVLRKRKETIKLIISDNGVGMPENIDIQEMNSLGWQLIIMLIKNQIKGEYKLKQNKGTEFIILFKNNA